MEDSDIGTYLNIEFKKGLAIISKGELVPGNEKEQFFEKENVKIMCKYRIMIKNLFNEEDFNEIVCKYFEQMNYLLEIIEYKNGTKDISVIDTSNFEIISRGNNLASILKEYEIKSTEDLNDSY